MSIGFYTEKPREVAPPGATAFWIRSVEDKRSLKGDPYLRLECTDLRNGITFYENVSLTAKSSWKVLQLNESVGLSYPKDADKNTQFAYGADDLVGRVGWGVLRNGETSKGNAFADVEKILTRDEAIKRAPALASIKMPADAWLEPAELRPIRARSRSGVEVTEDVPF